MLQLGYIFIVKNKEYEYILDSLLYIINEIIILSATYLLLIIGKKNKTKNIIIGVICLILTSINIAFMLNNGIQNKSIISFSKNFSNELVLKQNKETGAISFYRSKFVLFAKKQEQFAEGVNGKIKTQWLTGDICNITYEDINSNLNVFIATYGTRGKGDFYYDVAPTLEGSWQVDKRFKYYTERKQQRNNNT